VLDRGETADYWLGAYMFNLIAAELVAVIISVTAIVVTYPDVPWNGIWILSIVLAALMPVLFFPFARTLWLAWDLYFRPREPADSPRAKRHA
jgi:O-antigen ligase